MPTAGQRILAADFDGYASTTEATTQSNIGTSFATGSPVVSATITAPTSGAVAVHLGGFLNDDAASGTAVYLDIEVREDNDAGALIVSPGGLEHRLGLRGAATGSGAAATRSSVLDGLTPGQVYYIEVQHRASAGSTADVAYRSLFTTPIV